MDEIRKIFREKYDNQKILTDYDPFDRSRNGKSFKRKLGGLLHFVAALNSISIDGLACLIIMLVDQYLGIRPALTRGFSFDPFFYFYPLSLHRCLPSRSFSNIG